MNSVIQRALRRLPLGRRSRVHYYDHGGDAELAVSLGDRWGDVELVADLRPTDRVLDMGCAEGLISFETAKHVAHVDGIEVSAERVRHARATATRVGVTNVSFQTGSVTEYAGLPGSYDVVLFLGVLTKRAGGRRVGLQDLEQMLKVARRQIVVRVNVQDRIAISLSAILATMDQQGFDAVCFSRREGHGNLIVGNRRGTDARLRAALPLIVMPAERMADHPCLRGVPVVDPDRR